MCDYTLHFRNLEAVKNNDSEYISEAVADLETIKSDPLQWSLLHHAVALENLGCVEEILQANNEIINLQDKYHRTALSLAAAKGNAAILDLLLQNNADTSTGLPVCYAALNGNVNCIQKLFDSGADINEIDSSREKSKRTPLINTVVKNNLEALKLLLSLGADVAFGAGEQMTALHWACLKGHTDCVAALLEANADLYSQCEHFNTPFDYAVVYEREDVVTQLLDHGYSVDTTDHAGYTPLHSAVLSGNINLVTDIINRSPDVNKKDNEGNTPLNFALSAHEKKEEIIQILLENDADVTLTDDSKWAPIHLCALIGNINYLKLILDKNNGKETVNAVTMRNITPLYLAAALGHVDICEELLKHGAFINIKINAFDNLWAPLPFMLTSKNIIKVGYDAAMIAKARKHNEVIELLENYRQDDNLFTSQILECVTNNNAEEITNFVSDINDSDLIGWTCLHHAANLNFPGIIQICLDNGADVNKDDKFGRTPLSIACGNGHLDVITLLLDNGADINLGWSLFHAISKNQIEAVKVLIERGVELNSLDPSSCTPLMCAVKENDVEIVKALVEAGADMSLQDECGQTALHFACMFGHTECALELISHEADVNVKNNYKEVPIMVATQHNSIEIVTALLENGADVNVKDRFNETPLHYATRNVAKECVIELLKHDQDVNAMDEDYSIPLFVSVDDDYDIFKLLLDSGADVNITMPGGWTVMHLVAYYGNIEFAKELIARGVDLNAFSSEKITPIYIAAAKGNLELVELLIENQCLAGISITDVGDAWKDEPYFLRQVPLKCNYTPLCAAVHNNNLDVIEFMLPLRSAAADIEALKDIAKTEGHDELCEYLESHPQD